MSSSQAQQQLNGYTVEVSLINPGTGREFDRVEAHIYTPEHHSEHRSQQSWERHLLSVTGSEIAKVYTAVSLLKTCHIEMKQWQSLNKTVNGWAAKALRIVSSRLGTL